MPAMPQESSGWWAAICNGLTGAVLLAACIALCSMSLLFLSASVAVEDGRRLILDADAVAVEARTIPPVANQAMALGALSLANGSVALGETAGSATATLQTANQILTTNKPVIAKTLLHIDQAAGESALASKQTYKASLQLAEASTKAVVLVDNANLLITQTTTLMKNANALVVDPSITRTLNSVDQTSAHLNATSAKVEKYVDRVTKPASVIKRVAIESLRLGAIAAKAFIP